LVERCSIAVDRNANILAGARDCHPNKISVLTYFEMILDRTGNAQGIDTSSPFNHPPLFFSKKKKGWHVKISLALSLG
jgi:hypothetical protein